MNSYVIINSAKDIFLSRLLTEKQLNKEIPKKELESEVWSREAKNKVNDIEMFSQGIMFHIIFNQIQLLKCEIQNVSVNENMSNDELKNISGKLKKFDVIITLLKNLNNQKSITGGGNVFNILLAEDAAEDIADIKYKMETIARERNTMFEDAANFFVELEELIHKWDTGERNTFAEVTSLIDEMKDREREASERVAKVSLIHLSQVDDKETIILSKYYHLISLLHKNIADLEEEVSVFNDLTKLFVELDKLFNINEEHFSQFDANVDSFEHLPDAIEIASSVEATLFDQNIFIDYYTQLEQPNQRNFKELCDLRNDISNFKMMIENLQSTTSSRKCVFQHLLKLIKEMSDIYSQVNEHSEKIVEVIDFIQCCGLHKIDEEIEKMKLIKDVVLSISSLRTKWLNVHFEVKQIIDSIEDGVISKARLLNECETYKEKLEIITDHTQILLNTNLLEKATMHLKQWKIEAENKDMVNEKHDNEYLRGCLKYLRKIEKNVGAFQSTCSVVLRMLQSEADNVDDPLEKEFLNVCQGIESFKIAISHLLSTREIMLNSFITFVKDAHFSSKEWNVHEKNTVAELQAVIGDLKQIEKRIRADKIILSLTSFPEDFSTATWDILSVCSELENSIKCYASTLHHNVSVYTFCEKRHYEATKFINITEPKLSQIIAGLSNGDISRMQTDEVEVIIAQISQLEEGLENCYAQIESINPSCKFNGIREMENMILKSKTILDQWRNMIFSQKQKYENACFQQLLTNMSRVHEENDSFCQNSTLYLRIEENLAPGYANEIRAMKNVKDGLELSKKILNCLQQENCDMKIFHTFKSIRSGTRFEWERDKCFDYQLKCIKYIYDMMNQVANLVEDTISKLQDRYDNMSSTDVYEHELSENVKKPRASAQNTNINNNNGQLLSQINEMTNNKQDMNVEQQTISDRKREGSVRLTYRQGMKEFILPSQEIISLIFAGTNLESTESDLENFEELYCSAIKWMCDKIKDLSFMIIDDKNLTKSLQAEIYFDTIISLFLELRNKITTHLAQVMKPTHKQGTNCENQMLIADVWPNFMEKFSNPLSEMHQKVLCFCTDAETVYQQVMSIALEFESAIDNWSRRHEVEEIQDTCNIKQYLVDKRNLQAEFEAKIANFSVILESSLMVILKDGPFHHQFCTYRDKAKQALSHLEKEMEEGLYGVCFKYILRLKNQFQKISVSEDLSNEDLKECLGKFETLDKEIDTIRQSIMGLIETLSFQSSDLSSEEQRCKDNLIVQLNSLRQKVRSISDSIRGNLLRRDNLLTSFTKWLDENKNIVQQCGSQRQYTKAELIALLGKMKKVNQKVNSEDFVTTLAAITAHGGDGVCQFLNRYTNFKDCIISHIPIFEDVISRMETFEKFITVQKVWIDETSNALRMKYGEVRTTESLANRIKEVEHILELLPIKEADCNDVIKQMDDSFVLLRKDELQKQVSVLKLDLAILQSTSELLLETGKKTLQSCSNTDDILSLINKIRQKFIVAQNRFQTSSQNNCEITAFITAIKEQLETLRTVRRQYEEEKKRLTNVLKVHVEYPNIFGLFNLKDTFCAYHNDTNFSIDDLENEIRQTLGQIHASRLQRLKNQLHDIDGNSVTTINFVTKRLIELETMATVTNSLITLMAEIVPGEDIPDVENSATYEIKTNLENFQQKIANTKHKIENIFQNKQENMKYFSERMELLEAQIGQHCAASSSKDLDKFEKHLILLRQKIESNSQTADELRDFYEMKSEDVCKILNRYNVCKRYVEICEGNLERERSSQTESSRFRMLEVSSEEERLSEVPPKAKLDQYTSVTDLLLLCTDCNEDCAIHEKETEESQEKVYHPRITRRVRKSKSKKTKISFQKGDKAHTKLLNQENNDVSSHDWEDVNSELSFVMARSCAISDGDCATEKANKLDNIVPVSITNEIEAKLKLEQKELEDSRRNKSDWKMRPKSSEASKEQKRKNLEKITDSLNDIDAKVKSCFKITSNVKKKLEDSFSIVPGAEE